MRERNSSSEKKGIKPGRMAKLMIQLTSVQRVTVMRRITEVKMKTMRVDPKELQRVRRNRKKPVKINEAQDIKRVCYGIMDKLKTKCK